MSKSRRHTWSPDPKQMSQISTLLEENNEEECENEVMLKELKLEDLKVMSDKVEEKISRRYKNNSYYNLHMLLR